MLTLKSKRINFSGFSDPPITLLNRKLCSPCGTWLRLIGTRLHKVEMIIVIHGRAKITSIKQAILKHHSLALYKYLLVDGHCTACVWTSLKWCIFSVGSFSVFFNFNCFHWFSNFDNNEMEPMICARHHCHVHHNLMNKNIPFFIRYKFNW